MSNSGFLWTDAGLAASSVATPDGPFIHIQSFRLGSGVGYNPTRSQTALQGSTLYTGTAATYTVVDANTLDVVLSVPINVGDFGFGEIGLYDNGNVLLAICVFSQLQEKIRAVGTQAGNRYRVHARLKLQQAPAICIVEVSSPMAMLEVPSWTALFPPLDQLNDANAVIVHESNSSGDSIVVVRDADLEWAILGYHKVFEGATTDTGASATVNTLINPGLAAQYFALPQTDSRYLIKFSTGDIRKITSQTSVDRVTWTPDLAYTPTGTVTVWKDDGLFGSEGVRIAGLSDYNTLTADFNRFWSTPSGVYSSTNAGIDQTPLPTLTTQPTLTDWTTFANKLRSLMRLQNYTTAQISKILDNLWIYYPEGSGGAGLSTLTRQFQSIYDTVTSTLDTTRNSIALSWLETSVISSLSRSRTAPWLTNVVLDFTVSQPSENRRIGIANAGGALTITGTSGSETAFFAGWHTLFQQIGSVVVDRGTTYSSNGVGTPSAFGLLSMDGVLRTLYTHSYLISSLSSTATYTLAGQISGSGVMTFKLTLSVSGSPYSFPDPGSVNISMSARRPLTSLISTPAFDYYSGAILGTSTF